MRVKPHPAVCDLVSSHVLRTRRSSPAFDVVRAARVELQVTDLPASEAFYVDALGLIVADRAPGAVYLRGWEERIHHSIALRAGPTAAVARASFRVAREEDLDLLARHLGSAGLPVQWGEGAPFLGRTLRTADSAGLPLEFFHMIGRVAPQLQRFDLHRGAPIMRLDHFNFHAPLIEEAVGFWLDLGFRCSEYIASDTGDERLAGVWLMRKPSVHDVAMTAGSGPRLHHVGLTVGEPASVLRACDQLAAAGYAGAIERGPGRHGVSNAFFVYLRDPDGHRVELYCSDYYTGDPDHQPIRWSVDDPSCRSFWGTRAPDSWYEESSVMLGLDGLPVAIVAASDERSELMG